MNISIVIPIFNESENITSLVGEIELAMKKTSYSYELILVNDASTDDTIDVLSKIYKKHNFNIKILNNFKNIGQSFSIIKGIKSSKSQTIVTLDGDGQNNPNDIPKLIQEYNKDKDLVLVGGIRLNRKDNFLKKISSKIANKIRMLILKDNCEDTGCSLKIFDKNIFLQFPEFNSIHRFIPALFSGYNKKTKFIPVDHRKRIYGKSNYGTLQRLFQGIKDIIKVRKIIKYK
tara:strand:+ start:204 stop:896 length:693 start_codon:yes stop_codon:yes gene_type:complete